MVLNILWDITRWYKHLDNFALDSNHNKSPLAIKFYLLAMMVHYIDTLIKILLVRSKAYLTGANKNAFPYHL
jgi:hypothetical protein